jgi:hypothetical protein
MTLSPDQAAGALRDIAQAQSRSARAYAYRQASPHLFLWGLVWAVAYGLGDAWPHRAGAIWAIAVVAGLVAGGLITTCRAAGAQAKTGLRFFAAISATAFAFIAATIAVMAPVTGRQVDAFIPLVVAAGYVLTGIWLGLRFVIAGAAVAALTLGGFFLLPAHFDLWMAAVGGGALILAGVWFRTV